MGQLIGGRYELYKKLPITNDFGADSYLAQDIQSATNEIVHLWLIKRPKANELVHLIFLERAKELHGLAHSYLTPLIDFDYDDKNLCYFLVYRRIVGQPLSESLGKIRTGPDWWLDVLEQICEALIFLHNRNLPHGSLSAKSVWLDAEGGLPLVLTEWGLKSMVDLLDLEQDPDPEWDPSSEYLEDDLAELGNLAVQLIRNKQKLLETDFIEAKKGVLPSMRAFLTHYDPQDGLLYDSPIEAWKDLQRARLEYQAQTTYYLLLSKTAVTRLQEMGFITKPENYLAIDLLEGEIHQEKFGRAYEGQQGTTYYITTMRFRLVCTSDRAAPERNLFVKTIECPTPTELVFEREKGLPIAEKLVIATSVEKIPRKITQVTTLLRRLEEHRLEIQATRTAEVAKRDRLSIWARVLELQKRILNDFKLPYSNWELIDEETSILVELSQELAPAELAGDEYLRMPISGSQRTTIVGFFEELNGNQMKIGLAREVDTDAIAKVGHITLDNAQLQSILNRQEEALRRLRFNESANPGLFHLLNEPSELKVVDREVATTFFNNTLDESQKDAVQQALSADDMFLVQGPPGTGKTSAIVELVQQVLSHDSQAKVLISSQSNVAVNHALVSLMNAAPQLRELIVRIGREEKVEATRDFLLEQQLPRWVEQVRTKSQAYLDQQQSNFTADSELVECLRIVDECDSVKRQQDLLQTQLQVYRQEFDEVYAQVKQLERTLARLRSFQQGAATLLPDVAEGDSHFKQLLSQFEQHFLTWGEQFLHQADETIKLSKRRAELQEQLAATAQAYNGIIDQVKAGESIVRETLRDKYQVDLTNLQQQRRFIEHRLSAQRERALRLGRLQKVQRDWLQQINKGTSELISIYLNKARVVGATCIGVAAKGDVSETAFDWVIIDEAGRATHPEILVPMVRGRRIVLVGDHRQLPPILDRDLRQQLLEDINVTYSDLETSLFQEVITAASDNVRATLRVQYRMHPAIGNLISECFYDGQLQSGIVAEDRQHRLSWASTPIIWYSTHQQRNAQERQVGSSYQNIGEANTIADLLNQIERELSERNLTKRVGIITGYMAQKHLLRQQLAGWNGRRWPHLIIEINTVDAYQGREMDYIIYSLVRNNPEGNIGFLRDPRRVNVALSRARELLFVVGNHITAETASTKGRDNPFFTVLKYIRQHPESCAIKII